MHLRPWNDDETAGGALVDRAPLWEIVLPRKPNARARKAATLASPALSSITAGAACDPVPTRTASWIARKARLEAMIRRWQRLESILHTKVRRRLEFPDAYDSDLPEACAMRILSQRIEAACPDLEEEAGAIRELPTMSAEGAIAKIELGLAVQGPFDWRDHALELLQEGLRDLRDMIGLEHTAHTPAHHEVGGL
jgi:hypothetical protein